MKKIGIIIFDYVLGYSPLPINTALALEREGYDVHIFIDMATYQRSKPTIGAKNVKIHLIDVAQDNGGKLELSRRWQTLPSVWIKKGVSRILKLPQSPFRDICVLPIALFQRLYFDRGTPTEKLQKQTATFIPGLCEFSEKLASSIAEDSYVCLLGFDLKGLIASTTVALKHRPMRPPVIYYSLELLGRETAYSPTGSALRSLERTCSQLCLFVVIADEARGMRFIEANRVPKEKLVYVPVSGLRTVYRDKGSYFRELFDIGPEKKILLHAGNLVRKAMCLEIAQAALNWGDDLVLILHSPADALSSDWFDPDYLDELKRIANNDKVYLSLKPLEWQQVPDMISSADIGLELYDWGDPSCYEIGRSSAKLVQYLQAGLPIIAVDFPSLKKVIQDCRCGETTHHPSGIEEAARKILSDYPSYREHAFVCYEENFHLSRYFDRVLEKISQIE
jgi:glycosyltransferase involved in cell wall biosynthesis